MNVNYHIAQYTNIITELKHEIERLKGKIADSPSDGHKTRSNHGKRSRSQVLLSESSLVFIKPCYLSSMLYVFKMIQFSKQQFPSLQLG